MRFQRSSPTHQLLNTTVLAPEGGRVAHARPQVQRTRDSAEALQKPRGWAKQRRPPIASPPGISRQGRGINAEARASWAGRRGPTADARGPCRAYQRNGSAGASVGDGGGAAQTCVVPTDQPAKQGAHACSGGQTNHGDPLERPGETPGLMQVRRGSTQDFVQRRHAIGNLLRP